MEEHDATTKVSTSTPPSVAAIIIASNGARWLPQVLSSLAQLEHLPNRWIGVDVGSDDDTSQLLTAALGAAHVVTVDPGTGFGDAVRAGLAKLPTTDWIWLLHDDAIVDPGALTALLAEATHREDGTPEVAVVGPKIREWPSLRRLLEVGVSITSTGARETGLEPGEPDAGQHDWAETVLAVSTAGMLVRRDVWDTLGGLDPELPLFFDDIDLGWRVSRAGYAVRYAPEARIFHVEASRRHLRRRTHQLGEQRAAAVYTILANETGPRFWWQSLRLFLGSVLRMLGSIIVRDRRGAAAEFEAVKTVYLRPGRMRAARARRVATASVPRRDLKPLFPSASLPYQHGLEIAANTWQALVKPEALETSGRRTSGEGGLVDEEQLVDDQPPLWRRFPWLVTIVCVSLLSLLAARNLFGSPLSSGALPPPPESVLDWWGMILGRFHDFGLGSTSWAPAYLVPLAVVATPFGATPGFVPWLLLVFAVPLAALTAHRFGRLISERRLARKVWAVTLGLSLVASGAVAQGRLGTVVALILAPVIANMAMRLLVTPSWQLTYALALVTGTAVAFAPIMIFVVLVGIVFTGLQMGWRMVHRHWIAVGIAAALCSPTLISQFVLHPARFWWEAGRPVPQPGHALEILAGQGGGHGSAAWWLSIPLVLLALVALVPAASRDGVAFGWIIGLTGLFVAFLGAVFSDDWMGLGAGVWFMGLATAVLLAAPSAVAVSRRTTAVLVTLALVFPVAVGGWWVGRGIDDPLTVAPRPQVPAYLADQGVTTAVLTGSASSGLSVEVFSGAGTVLGAERMKPSGKVADTFIKHLQNLIANPTLATVDAVGDDGVDAIYLPYGDTTVERALDSAPNLNLSGSDRPGARVWLVADASRNQHPDHPKASVLRPVLAGLWLLGWLVVLGGCLPVRVPESESSWSQS